MLYLFRICQGPRPTWWLLLPHPPTWFCWSNSYFNRNRSQNHNGTLLRVVVSSGLSCRCYRLLFGLFRAIVQDGAAMVSWKLLKAVNIMDRKETWYRWLTKRREGEGNRRKRKGKRERERVIVWENDSSWTSSCSVQCCFQRESRHQLPVSALLE